MKQETIRRSYREPGIFVRVRPCAEQHGGKTFLGIYIGDLSARGYGDDGKLKEKPYMHNPCIWVPNLKEYIFGFESWWGEIKSEDDLKQITDADIDNVWYVRALKALHS
jgi:hypothetical protein